MERETSNFQQARSNSIVEFRAVSLTGAGHEAGVKSVGEVTVSYRFRGAAVDEVLPHENA